MGDNIVHTGKAATRCLLEAANDLMGLCYVQTACYLRVCLNMVVVADAQNAQAVYIQVQGLGRFSQSSHDGFMAISR